MGAAKISLKTLEEKQNYLRGQLGRAQCHREDYVSVLTSFHGLVMLYADPGMPWEGTETNGVPGIMLTFYVDNQAYTMRYFPAQIMSITDPANTHAYVSVPPDTKARVLFDWFNGLKPVQCLACGS